MFRISRPTRKVNVNHHCNIKYLLILLSGSVVLQFGLVPEGFPISLHMFQVASLYLLRIPNPGLVCVYCLLISYPIYMIYQVITCMFLDCLGAHITSLCGSWRVCRPPMGWHNELVHRMFNLMRLYFHS